MSEPARMPAAFLGHGNPMNALDHNRYTEAWQALGESVGRPTGVVAISAHWYINATAVTAMAQPRTIHDFYGFPEELYEVEYPAPGAPHLAADLAGVLGGGVDQRWGLDHASWSPMRHMWPDASIPTVELSIDLRMPAREHYGLGRKLSELPDQGVLVLGSGNIVHNLGALDWDHPHGGYEWCAAFDAEVAERLENRDDAALIEYATLPGGRQSVPTPDHYLPLLYAAAAAGTDVPARTVYEGLEMGSLSMRCVLFG
jgi:4,5-DOPA dioxygenase extradiol